MPASARNLIKAFLAYYHKESHKLKRLANFRELDVGRFDEYRLTESTATLVYHDSVLILPRMNDQHPKLGRNPFEYLTARNSRNSSRITIGHASRMTG